MRKEKQKPIYELGEKYSELKALNKRKIEQLEEKNKIKEALDDFFIPPIVRPEDLYAQEDLNWEKRKTTVTSSGKKRKRKRRNKMAENSKKRGISRKEKQREEEEQL